MGCLTATFNRVGGMTACFRKGGGMSCAFNREPSVVPGSFDSSFDYSFASNAGGLQVSFGLVCSKGIQKFVKVEKEWVFLVPENLFTDDNIVYSNVEWNIT